MKRILWLFVLVAVLFIFPAPGLIKPSSAKAQIAILDLNGNEVSKLVDGNSIRLRINLDEAASQPALVAFSLDRPGYVVAGCPVLAGEKSCQSEPFRSLGWFWGPTSTASAVHTVLASLDGVPLEASALIVVAPRPVVMVHGFLSDYRAWVNYSGPQGYLAGIGVPGICGRRRAGAGRAQYRRYHRSDAPHKYDRSKRGCAARIYRRCEAARPAPRWSTCWGTAWAA